ncbi:hypothetical protein GC093_27050 [Paenibacillus sp. LMG 31456]|uniref:Uncharacterized protein n=1 Tax=Paenibacillus foliorum TaxID=2654974 RepID=A0A972GUC3_9BACL|nr:hypothetical protein [Paenibacillus foliorum]NOU96852.1 hypothetical protein [Paenibacillus foliorum]
MVQNLRKLIQQVASHAEQFTFKATQLKQRAVESGIASGQITKTVQGLAIGSERQHNNICLHTRAFIYGGGASGIHSSI